MGRRIAHGDGAHRGVRLARLAAASVLSAFDGHLLGRHLPVPFLADVDVHIRFLIAMPLLVGAELVVHQRMRPIMQLFLDRRLIPDSAVTRFREAIASALRLRNSVIAELLLIAFVYIVGVTIVWRQYIALGTATWYATPSSGGTTLTLAGIWYGYLSLPLVQFLMCRWYFRVLIWTRLLWHISRIDLDCFPRIRIAWVGWGLSRMPSTPSPQSRLRTARCLRDCSPTASSSQAPR